VSCALGRGPSTLADRPAIPVNAIYPDAGAVQDRSASSGSIGVMETQAETELVPWRARSGGGAVCAAPLLAPKQSASRHRPFVGKTAHAACCADSVCPDTIPMSALARSNRHNRPARSRRASRRARERDDMGVTVSRRRAGLDSQPRQSRRSQTPSRRPVKR
jgi:hypothetical protein